MNTLVSGLMCLCPCNYTTPSYSVDPWYYQHQMQVYNNYLLNQYLLYGQEPR